MTYPSTRLDVAKTPPRQSWRSQAGGTDRRTRDPGMEPWSAPPSTSSAGDLSVNGGKQPQRHPEYQELDHERLDDRARRSLSSTPRPLVRWAGSKQKLLPQLVPGLPKHFVRYFEPFFGGGSLFFLLTPSRAVVNDACAELIETHRAVRDRPDLVWRYLQRLDPLDREQFYHVRQRRSSGRFTRAAEFLFLNRAGWNGLYRVNSRGEYNVPYGLPRTRNIVDKENLLACSEALRGGIELRSDDFEGVVDRADDGDLVFLDPPYVTGHNNNGFIDYNETLFSWEDQRRLAASAKRAVKRGARVLVTNAHHDAVLQLYSTFALRDLSRSSTLASRTSARRRVQEALLVG